MKTCGQCQLFRPSPYNPAKGSGMCGVMVDWLRKHDEQGIKPKPGALQSVYQELGASYGTPQAIFWPKSDRDLCKRFTLKNNSRNFPEMEINREH